jgi:hypothetical protein
MFLGFVAFGTLAEHGPFSNRIGFCSENLVSCSLLQVGWQVELVVVRPARKQRRFMMLVFWPKTMKLSRRPTAILWRISSSMNVVYRRVPEVLEWLATDPARMGGIYTIRNRLSFGGHFGAQRRITLALS